MSTFDDIARALVKLADRFECNTDDVEPSDPYDRHGKIRDINGNTVGQWDIK
jgi:hypothetical protein